MRVSIIPGDSGYNNYAVAKANCKNVYVYLDGIEQPYCITADEEKGFIERDVVDDAGVPRYDEMKESFLREAVRGVVRVEMRAEN